MSLWSASPRPNASHQANFWMEAENSKSCWKRLGEPKVFIGTGECQSPLVRPAPSLVITFLWKTEKLKCVPAAAVRVSLHFHLIDCSVDFRGLWVWLAYMGYWFLQVMPVFPHQQCGALGPVVWLSVWKEFWINEGTSKVVSPNPFIPATQVRVMRSQPHTPQGFSLIYT